MPTSEVTLAQKGNWDEDFKQDEGNGGGNGDRPKTLYMDITKSGKYQVRPVGPHIKCRKFFNPYRCTLQDSDKETDPAWKAGFFPSRRYAINVIDRADGILKVLEKGTSVFKWFANYKAVSGKNPSNAKEGSDFVITVTVPKLPNGQPNKLKTEYMVMPVKETPLSKEEIEMIKAQKLWPLTEIYKSTPLEKRQQMWSELSDSAKIPPKKGKDEAQVASEGKTASKPPQPVEETMDDAPAASSDLFDDNNEEEASGEKTDSAELF